MCDLVLRELTLLESYEECIRAIATKDDILKTLISYQEDFSPQAGFYVSQINTAWRNAHDRHEGAIRELREWCKLVISLLQFFERVEDAESRQTIIDAIINGEQILAKVAKMLEECQKNLNEIAGKIEVLQRQLNLDFEVHSTFYQSLVKKTRYQYYSGAAVGTIAASFGARTIGVAVAAETTLAATSLILVGPLGIGIVMGAVGIASIAVVEGKIRPQLLAHLADIKAKFENIQLHTKDASAKVDEVAAKLRQDLKETSGMETKGTSAKIILILREPPVDLVICHMKELGAACAKFIDDHPID